MWIAYPARIQEDVETLLSHEKRLRGSRLSDRVKMLRLLKSGQCRSHLHLVSVLGHSDRTLRRWWRVYQQQGLSALLSDPPPGGRPEQMTASARQALEEAMKQGQIATLEQARLRRYNPIRERASVCIYPIWMASVSSCSSIN